MTTPASASWLFELFELREPETQLLEERMPERRIQDRRKIGNGSQDCFNGTRVHGALKRLDNVAANCTRFGCLWRFCRIPQTLHAPSMVLSHCAEKTSPWRVPLHEIVIWVCHHLVPVVIGEPQACRHAVLTANYARQ